MPQRAQQNTETKAQQQSHSPCQRSKLKHAPSKIPSQLKTSSENYKTRILTQN